MKTPLFYKVYRALRRGWKRMTPAARHAVQAFVASQQTAHGYMNAGGREDAYYTQFGRLLEAVFTPAKVLLLPKRPLVVKESLGRDTVYAQFFDFLQKDASLPPLHSSPFPLHSSLPPSPTTNAVCCLLAMQHQTGEPVDAACVEWLRQRQDETGGFRASEQAPIPDLLSTAVALFSLRLIGADVKDASQFIQAHWQAGGGFAPTLYDDYSDVEYVFYGLLALGTK